MTRTTDRDALADEAERAELAEAATRDPAAERWTQDEINAAKANASLRLAKMWQRLQDENATLRAEAERLTANNEELVAALAKATDAQDGLAALANDRADLADDLRADVTKAERLLASAQSQLAALEEAAT